LATAPSSHTRNIYALEMKDHLPGFPAVGYDFCGLDVIL